jgi:hypothetical protein
MAAIGLVRRAIRTAAWMGWDPRWGQTARVARAAAAARRRAALRLAVRRRVTAAAEPAK